MSHDQHWLGAMATSSGLTLGGWHAGAGRWSRRGRAAAARNSGAHDGTSRLMATPTAALICSSGSGRSARWDRFGLPAASPDSSPESSPWTSSALACRTSCHIGGRSQPAGGRSPAPAVGRRGHGTDPRPGRPARPCHAACATPRSARCTGPHAAAARPLAQPLVLGRIRSLSAAGYWRAAGTARYLGSGVGATPQCAPAPAPQSSSTSTGRGHLPPHVPIQEGKRLTRG